MRRHNGGRIVPKCIRWIGSGVTVAVFVFAAVAVVLHGLRPDLDWMHQTLSAYLRGPFGAWLKAAYLLLSVALAALGLAIQKNGRVPRKLRPRLTSVIPEERSC